MTNTQRRRTAASGQDLVFLPLGGAGEIGMNMYLYGLGNARRRKWIMIDCGVKFGDERDPGIDVILPDAGFIESERHNLLGIVLTHGHEDHLGAVARLWPRLRAPVFCTPFAGELLKNKLHEAGLSNDVRLNIQPVSARFDLGPFDIEFVSVTHSIPEPNALVIRTSAGLAVHSGDLKIDRHPTIPPHIDEARFRGIGKEGVDALICDSTNVVRTGHSPSEREISASLETIISRATGRVAVTTFASHVGRLKSIADAAKRAGREVILAGRAMRNITQAALAVGLLQDTAAFHDEEAFGYLPPDKVLLMCTGSQGEARAALSRIARNDHQNIAFDAGDTVIFSSKTIPGNEKPVAEVINQLAALGVEVITGDDALVHTSGHARQGELAELYDWLQPKAVIPMHGEMLHLTRHIQFARAQGIAGALLVTNGQMATLMPGTPQIIDDAPAGRLHVDGHLISSSEDGASRFRRRLSFAGIAVVSVVLDERGKIVCDAEAVLDGLPGRDAEGRHLSDILLDAAEDALDGMSRKRRLSDRAVTDTVRIAVRRACEASWGKRPICHVLIHRV